MNEYELIGGLAARFARSPRQRNAPFECDGELLEIGGELWAASIDEFSPGEDGFTDGDPYRLGANLAVATLSDLFACGAAPAFFLQALCLPPGAGSAFTDGLTQGVADTLAAVGCHLCGGDLGCAETWRYTGFALGRVAGERALTRRITPPGPVELWISGPLGDANLAAAAGLPTPALELRTELARWLAGRAAACIDTSGGLWDALELLARLNPGCRFELDLDAIPLADGVELFGRAAGFPPVAALIGGAGEYELLFALEPAADNPDRIAAIDPCARRIGRAAPSEEPGFYARRRPWPVPRRAPAGPDARAFPTRQAYLEAVARTAWLMEAGD